MTASINDRPSTTIGDVEYVLRTPAVHDGPRLRRTLTRQRVRRPNRTEFLVAAREGVRQMAVLASDPEEGARQAELVERWHSLLDPLDEDTLEQADPVERAAEHATREAERVAALTALAPEIRAIEANLERHFQPYAELKADRDFWDDVSRIEVVRLLLVSAGGTVLQRDEDGLLTDEAYRSIPSAHRAALATFAFGLISVSETQRKN